MQSLKGVTSSDILRSMYFANFYPYLRYSMLGGGGGGVVMGKVNKFLNYRRE
jgi:hypothetical protein